MRAPVLTLITLLLGFALMQMSNGLQGTLLAVRAGTEGFGALPTGLIMSGFFAGMSIRSLVAPRLIDSVGHIRTFAALASLASAAALMHLVFIDPWVWIAIRSLTGFAFAGLIIVTESWLNATPPPVQGDLTGDRSRTAREGAGWPVRVNPEPRTEQRLPLPG